MKKVSNWNKINKALNTIKMLCIIIILVMTIVHYQTDKTELRVEGFNAGVSTATQNLVNAIVTKGVTIETDSHFIKMSGEAIPKNNVSEVKE